MYGQEEIETINAEQLATATDRVLLAARFGRARPSAPSLSLQATRASSHRLAAAEQTVFTRRPRHDRSAWRGFTATALVTSLLSVGTAIAILI